MRERYYPIIIFCIVLGLGCKLARGDCLHCLIRVKANEGRRPTGKVLVEPDHPGIFVVNLPAQCHVFPHIGIRSCRRASGISLQDRK